MSELGHGVLVIAQLRPLHRSPDDGLGSVEMTLVFTTADGGPPDGMNLTHHFQRLLRRAGLPQRRFHDLRHSCATVLLGQHVPARVVMEILGHSQISVTMNT